jgi:integrase
LILVKFSLFYGLILSAIVSRSPVKKTRNFKPLRAAWPTVRLVLNHGQWVHQVDSRKKGFAAGRRLFFQDAAEALASAETIAKARENEGAAAFSDLSVKERMDAGVALGILEQVPGSALTEAAQHFVEFKKAEAIRQAGRSFAECVDEYLSAKRIERDRGDLKPVTYTELKSKLGIAKDYFADCRLSEITRARVEEFLSSLPHAARGRFNIRVKLNQCLNFAVAREWLDKNPALSVKVRVHAKEVHILTIDEAARLLRACETCPKGPQVVLPYALVGLFAGLRPGEAEALRWEEVHFDTCQIEVLARTSKTRETRFVEMEPMLVEWLLPYRQRTCRIIGRGFEPAWKAVRQATGLCGDDGASWVKDTLRHCYGSYWLPIYKNRAHLAELMGNSLQVIKAHYKRAINPGVAEKFWALRPSSEPSQIVPFVASA